MKDRNEEASGTEPRQAYRKPQLRTVRLVAGEVLVTGCKLADGGKNVGIDNATCTQPTVCVNAGS